MRTEVQQTRLLELIKVLEARGDQVFDMSTFQTCALGEALRANFFLEEDRRTGDGLETRLKAVTARWDHLSDYFGITITDATWLFGARYDGNQFVPASKVLDRVRTVVAVPGSD